MNYLLQKPHRSVWASVPLIILISLGGIHTVLDLQLHDTYLVLASPNIGILFSLLLGLIGLTYWLFRDKKLVDWMTSTHVLLTIVCALLLVLTGIFSNNLAGADYSTFRVTNQILVGLIIVFIVSQIVLLINLGISTIRNQELP